MLGRSSELTAYARTVRRFSGAEKDVEKVLVILMRAA